jgi:hypothetical protein
VKPTSTPWAPTPMAAAEVAPTDGTVNPPTELTPTPFAVATVASIQKAPTALPTPTATPLRGVLTEVPKSPFHAGASRDMRQHRECLSLTILNYRIINGNRCEGEN